MLRKFRWAVWFRMWVHSAPLAPLATCWAHDQSSGSDFTNQYAMAIEPPSGISPTIAHLSGFVDAADAGYRRTPTAVQSSTPRRPDEHRRDRETGAGPEHPAEAPHHR